MDPAEPIIATSSLTATTSGVPQVGFDVVTPIINLFGGSETASGLLSFGGILGFLGAIWNVFTIVGYLIAILLLVLYVYASVRRNLYEELLTQQLRDQEKMYDEVYRGNRQSSRLNDIFAHIESEHPNDWKLAIIEADIILDDILKKRGYAGNSLGERLKSISPQQLASLNDAWEAHKVRNRIAHDGADFVLTKRIAENTIAQYRRVFAEFGVT